jgi:hypothetical protein
MLDHEVEEIAKIITELWPRVGSEKHGWGDLLWEEFGRKLAGYEFESAKVILTTMRFEEKGNRFEPDVGKFMARLRLTTAPPVEFYVPPEERPETTERQTLAEWRIHYNEPENFGFLSPKAQEGCRWMWGDKFGTGASLLDTTERRERTTRYQDMKRIFEMQAAERRAQRGPIGKAPVKSMLTDDGRSFDGQ